VQIFSSTSIIAEFKSIVNRGVFVQIEPLEEL